MVDGSCGLDQRSFNEAIDRKNVKGIFDGNWYGSEKGHGDHTTAFGVIQDTARNRIGHSQGGTRRFDELLGTQQGINSELDKILREIRALPGYRLLNEEPNRIPTDYANWLNRTAEEISDSIAETRRMLAASSDTNPNNQIAGNVQLIINQLTNLRNSLPYSAARFGSVGKGEAQGFKVLRNLNENHNSIDAQKIAEMAEAATKLIDAKRIKQEIQAFSERKDNSGLIEDWERLPGVARIQDGKVDPIEAIGDWEEQVKLQHLQSLMSSYPNLRAHFESDRFIQAFDKKYDAIEI